MCFVISPFGGWHDEYHREIFCEAINAVGLEPARADDLFTSTNIVHDIWHLVSKSRVMLADLTGKNPNVFYELGLAHAARKPVLLLAQSMDDVPFDLRALRVITYDVEHPAWGDVLRDAITQGLKETLESPERSVLPTFLLEDPKAQPRVTEDERRLLTIEQQLNSLAREVRAAPVPESRGLRDLRPNEALDRMQRYRAQGLPEAAIKRRLEARGVPPHWIEENLRRLEREEG